MTVTYLFDHETISDEELAALALAADGDDSVPDDAVPFYAVETPDEELPLPSWYMPAPMGRRRALRGWRRIAVFSVIAAFLAIDCYGMCDTYGDLRVGVVHHAVHVTAVTHHH